MNQRPFSPVTGEAFKVQNYYFQIILQRLIPKRTPNPGYVKYTFTPFKGTQKYESSKTISLQLGDASTYPLQNVKVNFVAISYNPGKSLSFAIRMVENAEDKDKQIGEYLLDANNYIDHFMQSENGAFTLKIDFNDDWAAQVELYVERTRYGVERLVREIKNPKPKENGEVITLSHQAIKQQRKLLDLEEEKEEEQAPHHQQFKKFSPRRESHEDANKKTQYFNRKAEEPVKKEAQVNPPKKEEKKSPKGEFVPKKEWMIPEAEKYMANKTKSSSRSNSITNAKIAQERSPSVVKEEKEQPRRRPKVVQQPSFLEKLPIKPKYLVLVAIAIAVLLASSFFLKSDPNPTPTLIKGPKAAKQKKPEKEVKVEKIQKTKGKGKK